MFLGPYIEFPDRTYRKKVKDRNLKAYIDRNTYVKSDLSHVTERNLPYKGK